MSSTLTGGTSNQQKQLSLPNQDQFHNIQNHIEYCYSAHTATTHSVLCVERCLNSPCFGHFAFITLVMFQGLELTRSVLEWPARRRQDVTLTGWMDGWMPTPLQCPNHYALMFWGPRRLFMTVIFSPVMIVIHLCLCGASGCAL